MRILNKIGFEKMGFPYYGWLISIHTAIIRISLQLKIPLFFIQRMVRSNMEVILSIKIKAPTVSTIKYHII